MLLIKTTLLFTVKFKRLYTWTSHLKKKDFSQGYTVKTTQNEQNELITVHEAGMKLIFGGFNGMTSRKNLNSNEKCRSGRNNSRSSVKTDQKSKLTDQ